MAEARGLKGQEQESRGEVLGEGQKAPSPPAIGLRSAVSSPVGLGRRPGLKWLSYILSPSSGLSWQITSREC